MMEMMANDLLQITRHTKSFKENLIVEVLKVLKNDNSIILFLYLA